MVSLPTAPGFAPGAMSCYYEFMEPLRFKPKGCWNLDDPSPFVDYSGYSLSATLTGTEQKGVALVPYAQYSQVLKSGVTITFAANVFIAGKESDDFTLVATVAPVMKGTTGPVQILSNSGKYDGLTIDGTKLKFSTAYVGQGEAACEYDLQFTQRVDIAGVHTRSKNTLYVNGVVVDEVNISAAQQAATYDAPDSNLYAGNSTSQEAIMLGQVTTYTHALQPEEIARIYQMNNRRAPDDVAKLYGGETLYVSTLVRPRYLDTGWFTADDWQAAQMNNVSVIDDQLQAERIDGLTVGGTWLDSIDLYNGSSATAIDSVNMYWTGKNVTVEASVDNTTWVTVTRGVNLSNIPVGFDPTNKALFVRITFANNQSEAYIDSLQVRGYLTNTVTPTTGRTITYTNPAVTFPERLPLELREDWGVGLTAGRVAFGADNAGDVYNARTIEVWMKKNSGTAPTFSFSPSSTFINGNTVASVGQGEWALYHYVLAANASTFYIDGTVTVGRVAIYDTALSSAQSLAIYQAYTGIQETIVDDGADIILSEPTTPAVVYAYDWGIRTA